MILHFLVFFVIVIVTSPLSSFAKANCTRICGTNAVQYPFGFSDGCEIPLDCIANGEIRMGEYSVQNITRDHIMVILPAKCDRRYEEIRVFGSQNYALSSRNGLLLENCSSTLNNCVMSTRQFENRFNLQQCDTGINNTRINNTGSIINNTSTTNSNSNNNKSTVNSSTVSCYSEDDPNNEELMNLTSLEQANCQVLFSSISVDILNGSKSTGMPVSFELQYLELSWWVRGDCSCNQNASCHNVRKANQTIGYRCNCNGGFAGDGFAAGEGCRKVAKCGSTKYMSGECEGTTRVGVLIGGIIAGALLMSISALICYCLKKQAALRHHQLAKQQLSEATGSFNVPFYHHKEIEWAANSFPKKQRLGTKHNANVETFLKNHEFLAPKRYTYSQVKKMTDSFKIKLGQGGFGSVYKGVLSNQNIVAVKVLSELRGNGEDFINEVASVGRTSHVNIVSLVGFCSEGHRRALIYEFMPNGSLERFIYGRSSSSSSQLGWEKLHEIAIGIARGLEYLHKGCNTRILHLDIKPHNILLDQNLCPKISDFGLSKLFPDRTSMMSMSRMRGTPGYIAPELFSRNFGQVSHKSDVYSYGMMVLEMVGGRKNIEVEVDHTSEIYFPHWIYNKLGLDEEQLELHGIESDEENEMARKMIIVGLWCIQTNPSNRPTITKVLEMLEGDSQSLEIPPKPYLSSPTRDVSSPPTE